MKLYLASLGAGLLVGVIYSLLNVRSPAPPVVALVGLLGILIGEQIVPAAKRVLAGSPLATDGLRGSAEASDIADRPGRGPNSDTHGPERDGAPS
ncbi:XapX domain-containing protein [Prosthecomicrobium sp. N25]|uniref:XapX domain-containing protein n=1 Tax=Prosthecomicrobium sp. N25 TaxID=3129254 RepID=UPI003076895A